MPEFARFSEGVRKSPISLVYISNHIHIRRHWKNALFIKKGTKEKVLWNGRWSKRRTKEPSWGI